MNNPDVNTILKIETIISKWNNEEINADECLYQINEAIKKNDDEFWDNYRRTNPVNMETFTASVKFVGKLPVSPERE